MEFKDAEIRDSHIGDTSVNTVINNGKGGTVVFNPSKTRPNGLEIYETIAADLGRFDEQSQRQAEEIRAAAENEISNIPEVQEIRKRANDKALEITDRSLAMKFEFLSQFTKNGIITNFQ